MELIFTMACCGALAVVASGCSSQPAGDSTPAPKPMAAPGQPHKASAPVLDAADSPASAAAEVLLPGDWFADVTERTGIEFVHHNGRESGRFYLIESFGAGAALVDFDQNGDADLFFTGGGSISAEPAPNGVDLISRLALAHGSILRICWKNRG